MNEWMNIMHRSKSTVEHTRQVRRKNLRWETKMPMFNRKWKLINWHLHFFPVLVDIFPLRFSFFASNFISKQFYFICHPFFCRLTLIYWWWIIGKYRFAFFYICEANQHLHTFSLDIRWNVKFIWYCVTICKT